MKGAINSMGNNWLKAIAIIFTVALVFTIVTSNLVSITAISVLKKAKTGTVVNGDNTPDTTKAPDNGNSGQVNNPDAGDNTGDTTAAPAGTDSTTASGGTAGTTASGGTAGTTASGGANANTNTFSKADAIKLINDATSKAANVKAGYTWSKQSAYTGDGLVLNVPGFVVSGVNAILGKLDTPTSIDNVVGNFIGIGELKGAVTKGTKAGKYTSKDGDFKETEYLVGAQLTEADVTKFEKNGDKVTLHLSACTEPIRDKKSSISRLTNDFMTKGDVVEALASQNDVPATLDEGKSSVSYNVIVVEGTIKDGKIVSLKYSYDWEANVTIKVSALGISGTGTANTTINYTNFVY